MAASFFSRDETRIYIPLSPSAQHPFTTIRFPDESKTIGFAGLFANFHPQPNPNHHKFRDLLFLPRDSATVLVVVPLPVGQIRSLIQSTHKEGNVMSRLRIQSVLTPETRQGNSSVLERSLPAPISSSRPNSQAKFVAKMLLTDFLTPWKNVSP